MQTNRVLDYSDKSCPILTKVDVVVLEDGHPSNTLFTYYIPGSQNFTRFEPQTPRYKKLKYGEIVSLTLKITDQNNNIITNGPGTTVLLHI